jgi:hypothetical protein
MTNLTCEVCGNTQEIKKDTLEKRIQRGVKLRCNDCLFDRTPNRRYSPEINDEIWEQIRVAYGIKGATERLVRF